MEYPVCSVANGRAFPQGRLLGQEDEAPKEQVQLLLEVMLPSHCPPCASVSPAGPERRHPLRGGLGRADAKGAHSLGHHFTNNTKAPYREHGLLNGPFVPA